MIDDINSWLTEKNSITPFKSNSIIIKSIAQLDEYLLGASDDIVYRGISKEEHLYPSIIRAYAEKYSKPINEVENHNEVSSLEREVFKDLINNGSTYLKDFSALGLLTTAQHFGLPTRCMDWTFNVYIAIYFALSNEISSKKYISIMSCSTKENLFWDDIPFQIESIEDLKFIDRSPEKNIAKRFDLYKKVFNKKDVNDDLRYFYVNNMHKSSSLNPLNDRSEINRATDIDITKIKNGKILFFNPNFNNERISVQQGIFHIPTKLGTRDIRSQLRNNVTFIVFDLESIGTSNFSKRMKQVGINGYKIMPDLENVCKNIRLKRIHGKYIG